ncbi:MAG: GntR family transcriptional regulator [Zavarzinia sp.]|nr:GntR family transcriptional regulator [Zavarzinia sp.]
MTPLDLLTAIGGTKSLSMLDGFCRALWTDWGAGRLTDEQAQSLSEAIEARRREVRGRDTVAARAPQVAAQARAAGRPSHFPPKRKAARSPNRRASIARRRTLAASGPMPPQLASQFTTGELAALRIVADAVRDRCACILTLGEIAARAGVCVTTARNALRQAAREGLVTIEERRRAKRPNLANVVRIISQEWRSWIERGPKRNSQKPAVAAEGGGCKKTGATDKGSFRTLHGDRVPRGQLSQNALRKTPFGVLLRT